MEIKSLRRNSVSKVSLMLLVTLFTALWLPTHVLAQTRDIITFIGGHADENNPGVYVIDAGPNDVIIDPDGGPDKIRIHLSRPLGATAGHEASITLNYLFLWDEGTTVTFEPGETEKTVEIEYHGYASESYDGNAPAVFSVLRTNYAEAAYEAVIYNISHTATAETPQCEYTTPLEALQAIDQEEREIYAFRYGNYLLLAFDLGASVNISADSRLVIQTRYVDHTNLPLDADDYGMSKTRNVVLTPINVGAVSNIALYLYRPSDDEYMYSFRTDYNGMNIDNSVVSEYQDRRSVVIGISELGPFRVANPADGAMSTIFFSQEDLQNTTFHLHYPLSSFIPEFSNISIDKTTYKSGETMAITATMDNWRVVKRALLRDFQTSFGVTLDGGQTTEPRRFDFDEATGTVTYYVTAPTVTSNTDVHVDLGPIVSIPVLDEGGFLDHYIRKVVAGSEGFFTVTVEPEPATPVAATAIDFVDMPADGSNIHLESHFLFGENTLSQQYSLAITSTPAGATDAGTVTFLVTNANGAIAGIGTNGDGSKFLDTGVNTGDITVTATLASGTSVSRTYHLSKDQGRKIHTANTYYAGTIFPKFQFEINRFDQLESVTEWSNWTAVDDVVTVNYTHANGNKWTEQYKFSDLPTWNKAEDLLRFAKLYNLPFAFTEEHPDATVEQTGRPIVSAEVIVNMKNNNNGHRIQVVSTASLVPRLKDFSFKGYSSYEEHYHMKSDPILTSEVLFLPTQGYTVGYEIPELGILETYNNQTDGDNVPEWLELENDVDGLYTTATIKVHPDLDKHQSYDLTFYTLAQRSYDPDEVMQRVPTSNVKFSPISLEGNMVYRVNGQNVTGDLTFDNSNAVETVINTLKANGFINRVSDATNFASLEEVFNKTKAHFTVFDVFDGADVTLTRQGEDEPLQTLPHYKGTFTFMPPSDGRTYIIDVYYPAFDKHYKSTFVSHWLQGVRSVDLNVSGVGGTYDYTFSYTNNGQEYNIPFSSYLYGYIYVEDADGFNLQKAGELVKPHLDFPEEFQAVVYNNTPELKNQSELYSMWGLDEGYADNYYASVLSRTYENPTVWWRQRTVKLNWTDIVGHYDLVTLVDSKGQAVKNATINFASVDRDMTNPTTIGSNHYDSNIDGYQLQIDPGKYAVLMEVNVEGRQHPVLYKIKLANSSYRWWLGTRRHNIVLPEDDDEVTQASLETLTLTGRYSKATEYEKSIKAENTPTNLLAMDKNTVLDYSETADYSTVYKLFRDERFGQSISGFRKKFARVTFNINADDLQSTDNLQLVNSSGTIHFSPDNTDFSSTCFIGKNVFTSFSTNHWLLDFDLTEQIAEGATEKLSLVRNGNETLMELPMLHNNSVDMLALTEQAKFDGKLTGYDVAGLDNKIEDHGGDMNKISTTPFSQFNFSTPPTLPFRLLIERKDNYFLVRGILEVNMIPYGQMEDMMDAAEYAEWFQDQFRECMNAVKNSKNEVEERVNEMKKMSGAFAGFKGYLSGIGHYNPKTGKLDVNFYDGGIIMEASAHVMEKRRMWIAEFGVSLDCGVFSTLGFLNRAAANGDVASTKIDMITESRFNLTVGAWAEASIDIKIATASIGVAGSASIDVRAGTVTPTYQKEAYAGSRVSFDFNLWAYLTARFLWWGGTKDYTILEAHDSFYDPDDSTNPYHSDFKLGGEPIFSMSSKSVPQNYKKLSRKTRRALEGTKLLDNVSGMAQPTYLMGGNSLLFNNLKTASDYNDDRLQLYSNGSKSDLVSTGINAPMYDFAEDHGDQTEVVAFEQLNETVDNQLFEGTEESGQQKVVSEMSEIHTAWRTNGGDWQTQTIGSLQGSACVSPAVAVSKEDYYATHAAVIWQQGKAKFTDAGERYIDGSLMLSRFDGSAWSAPIELVRINHRNVPVEYKASIKLDGNNDQVLVAMTVKQDANNPNEGSKLVYLNALIDPLGDCKVQTRYTNVEARMLQMERVIDPNSQQGEVFTDATNLVAYMEYNDNGRDLRLTAVDMTGLPTGKLNGRVGMVGRMVNDYRLVVDDNARDLSGVALLWNQSDEETTDNGDGTQTMEIKNRIYASKLCSNDQQIYFSSPITVADIENGTEKMVLASMDGYLNGLDMKVAYSAANYSDAASVREVPVVFTNDIEHTARFNPYDVNSPEQVPVTITVENKGFEPIDKIDVTMNGNTTSYDVKLMPREKTSLKVPCSVTNSFNGTIDYDVTANFIAGNSNALKARRRGAASKAPQRVIRQSGTQIDVRQMDMALKVLSKKTDAQGVTTIVAEVNNASLLPLADGMNVKVGLYNSPIVDANAVSYAEVTVNASDLYDATEKQNKVKIVTLTVQQPDFDQMLYLCTTPMQGSEVLPDVRPTNNVLPVNAVGKYMLGDVNGDRKVTITDAVKIISKVNGGNPTNFNEKAADVTRDNTVTVNDAVGVVNMILKKK